MRMLIAVASKHGSTHEIADALADEVRQAGLDAVVAAAADAPSVAGYDAVVVGSALYMGKWLRDAQAFVDRHRQVWPTVPVWLFSSGPLGPPAAQPAAEPANLAALLATTGARDHRVFVGKLDRSALGIGERLAIKLVKAPEGDFRDWEAIRAWAREIATALVDVRAAEHALAGAQQPPSEVPAVEA